MADDGDWHFAFELGDSLFSIMVFFPTSIQKVTFLQFFFNIAGLSLLL